MATPAQIVVQQANIDQQHRRALEDQGRQQTLEFNQGILNNPDAPEEAKLQARQNIQGLYPTPAHAPQFLLDLLHIKHRQAQGNQPQQSQAQSKANAITNTPATGDGGSESTLPGPPDASNPVQAIQGGAAPQVTPSAAPSPASASPSPTSAAQPPIPVAQVRQVAQAQTPDQALQMIRAYASPQQAANSLAQQMQDKMAQREAEIAEKRGQYGVQEALIRAQGNPSMQKLNGAAQSLGADDFASASPEIKMQAIKALHMANITNSWKSVQDGNNIYAVDAHDPNGQRTLIGHKDDLTSHSEWKTMNNPDGSTYLVPVTTWTKKGSSVPIIQTQSDTTPPLPVSANTPAVPTSGVSNPPNGGAVTSTAPQPPPVSAKTPNPGARQPGTKPSGGAVKGTSPAPGVPRGAIPFGGKASPLLKSDQEQYTKAAEDATSKRQQYENARGLLDDPTRKTDLELVFSWVRSNVQGAGRMTNTEINQAAQVGSFGQRIQNAWSQATTGKLAPEIEKQFIDDIHRAYLSSQKAADDLRSRVDDEMHGKTPVSSKAPAGPSAKPANAVGTVTYQGKKYWVDKDRNNLGEAQ